MKRVVVTGLGAITPIGNTVPAYLESLRNGVSGAAPITQFDTTHFKTKFACEVKNFNPDEFIDRKEVRRIDRFTQFALVSAGEAIRDAGFDLDAVNKQRVGVIWASGIGGLHTLEKEIEEHITGSGAPRHNPFLIPKMIINMGAGMISIQYGFMESTTLPCRHVPLPRTPSSTLPIIFASEKPILWLQVARKPPLPKRQ